MIGTSNLIETIKALILLIYFFFVLKLFFALKQTLNKSKSLIPIHLEFNSGSLKWRIIVAN